MDLWLIIYIYDYIIVFLLFLKSVLIYISLKLMDHL